MAIVEERTVGSVTIRFHDDYCQNTNEDTVQRILDKIAARALIDLNATGKNISPQSD